MERSNSSTDLGGVRVDVGLQFHKIIDYDRKAMRRALSRGAADVRKEARRLLSRRAISAPGEMPGMVTGDLRRAIGIVSRGTKGGWVKIAPRSIEGSKFYPAFLFYGSRKRNIAPRGNYMAEALQRRRESVRSMIQSALRDSLVPR